MSQRYVSPEGKIYLVADGANLNEEPDDHFRMMKAILNQKPNDRCPTCPCCDLAPDYGNDLPAGYCCGAYVSGGACHRVIDAEYGSEPRTMAEWIQRAALTRAALEADDAPTGHANTD